MSAAKQPEIAQSPAQVFLRAKRAAQALAISESTLWEWTQKRPGFPQPLRPSHRVTLFDVEAIAKHLKETAHH